DYGAILNRGKRWRQGQGSKYATEFGEELDVPTGGKWDSLRDRQSEFAAESNVFLPVQDVPWPDSYAINFITIGRLSPEKDHAKLIHAFKQVVGYGNTRLYIVGEGALEDDLKKLVNQLGLTEKIVF